MGGPVSDLFDSGWITFKPLDLDPTARDAGLCGAAAACGGSSPGKCDNAFLATAKAQIWSGW
jgi:hypothetical protein